MVEMERSTCYLPTTLQWLWIFFIFYFYFLRKRSCGELKAGNASFGEPLLSACDSLGPSMSTFDIPTKLCKKMDSAKCKIVLGYENRGIVFVNPCFMEAWVSETNSKNSTEPYYQSLLGSWNHVWRWCSIKVHGICVYIDIPVYHLIIKSNNL